MVFGSVATKFNEMPSFISARSWSFLFVSIIPYVLSFCLCELERSGRI